MELDDFARGAAASLLIDQVDVRTGFVTKVSLSVVVAAVGVVVFADGLIRWPAGFLALVALGVVAFVYLARRLALRIINRLAPPVGLAGSRQVFDTALAEADIPTGPVGFMRLIWRLRRGVGPEVARLGAVASRLKSDLD